VEASFNRRQSSRAGVARRAFFSISSHTHTRPAPTQMEASTTTTTTTTTRPHRRRAAPEEVDWER
jgi:hypothetical protein